MIGALARLFSRGAGEEPAGDPAEARVVRRIARALSALPADRARYLAGFAFVLHRAAYADLEVSAVEARRMERILRRHGGLPEAQAALVVEIARHQHALLGGVEDFPVTRQLKRAASHEDRLHLLDCAFEVAVSDARVTGEEEEEIRRIATELGLSHREYVAARAKHGSRREILRTLPGRNAGQKSAADRAR